MSVSSASSLVTLRCRRDHCREPTAAELALFTLSADIGETMTLFEANSHVMTQHYKYYLIPSSMVVDQQAEEGKDEYQDQGSSEVVVAVVSQSTSCDGGDPHGACPDGGFRRTYFLCKMP